MTPHFIRCLVGVALASHTLLATAHAQGTRPHPAPKPSQPLYDSTKMDLSNSPGISHKTAMQAARTYGKLGAHQPLDHTDSVFLRQWSPAIIGAPDNPAPPVVKPRR